MRFSTHNMLHGKFSVKTWDFKLSPVISIMCGINRKSALSIIRFYYIIIENYLLIITMCINTLVKATRSKRNL